MTLDELIALRQQTLAEADAAVSQAIAKLEQLGQLGRQIAAAQQAAGMGFSAPAWPDQLARELRGMLRVLRAQI